MAGEHWATPSHNGVGGKVVCSADGMLHHHGGGGDVIAPVGSGMGYELAPDYIFDSSNSALNLPVSLAIPHGNPPVLNPQTSN